MNTPAWLIYQNTINWASHKQLKFFFFLMFGGWEIQDPNFNWISVWWPGPNSWGMDRVSHSTLKLFKWKVSSPVSFAGACIPILRSPQSNWDLLKALIPHIFTIQWVGFQHRDFGGNTNIQTTAQVKRLSDGQSRQEPTKDTEYPSSYP